MQTNIHPDLVGKDKIAEAEEILRSCVHCGFCMATCPTYQLLGDELDGPRGRIYLVKNLLETNSMDDQSATHLDRCLTCRSCETTCPSGVRYGRLLDIARDLMVTRVRRPLRIEVLSRLLRWTVPHPRVFGALLRLGQLVRPVLPMFIAGKVPLRQTSVALNDLPNGSADKTVILLQGCVQRAATPGVNEAIQSLLQASGCAVEYLTEEGCCGGLDYHLSDHETGVRRMQTLVDQLYPRLDSVEAIVSSASGCGVTIKEYPEILDSSYADRAAAIVDKVVDISELLDQESFTCRPIRVAVHTPCTLQHGQQIDGVIEQILARAGCEIVPSNEGHLCCGSAGTYSVLQPKLAERLRDRKLGSLLREEPEVIVTANVGCQLHLQSGTGTPVMHWTELLARQL
ncbi:MAG TPA: glycolate oxidase iron-sulfur subunit [Gammaproteobacteria bacterium]|nr:glycolate oxidase iron-sulfur subunit [Gammaproteobacteria bacterium]